MTDYYEVDLIDYDLVCFPLFKSGTAVAVYTVDYDMGYHGEQVTTPTLVRIACEVGGTKFDVYPDNVPPDWLNEIYEVCNEHLRDME